MKPTIGACFMRFGLIQTVSKALPSVRNDTHQEDLQALKDQGVIGIAFNASLKGVAYYENVEPLLSRLSALDMWAQFQVEGDQLPNFLPMIERTGVKVLIDHCARPYLDQGFEAAGILALKSLAQSGQTVVKISGFSKFSKMPSPLPTQKRMWISWSTPSNAKTIAFGHPTGPT
jgi:predicted TIM-barrel fold metal-dependent hydrolase